MTPACHPLAKASMTLLGKASLGAFANAAFEFAAVAPDRIDVEAWLMFVVPALAGLVILLGMFPRRMPGFWELVIYRNKVVPLFLTSFIKAAVSRTLIDTGVIPVDSMLVVTTLFYYRLAQGWRAWLPRPRALASPS